MHIICKGVKFCENRECIHELCHTVEVTNITLNTTHGIATIITLHYEVSVEAANFFFFGCSLQIMNTFTMESIHDLCGRHTHAVIASRSRLLGIGKV